MPTYSAIQEAGTTLVDLIWNYMKDDRQINPSILKSKTDIRVDSISNMENSGQLTLFLYRVESNSQMRNHPRDLRNNGNNGHILVQPPLPLDLYYLVIPHTPTVEKDHVLLGKVIQTFYDHSVLDDTDLRGSLKGSGQKLRIVPEPFDTEEINKLWALFKEHDYRLSVSYMLTPIKLDSKRQESTHLVEEKVLGVRRMDE